MRSNVRLANDAWEALFRAQATIARELAAEDVWGELVPTEYGVLYALASAPTGLRMSDLCNDVLLSQPGLSRLVARLEARGLVVREVDPNDARASLLRLSKAGKHVQRRVGAAHGRHVASRLSSRLNEEQLSLLRHLCGRLVAPSTLKQRKREREQAG
jgi:DNA-binding MarR family transcriptional regulator